MALQWFPGHMHKALKEIKESLNQVDILIEVLDARIPYSSENPEISKNTTAISPVLKFLISMAQGVENMECLSFCPALT